MGHFGSRPISFVDGARPAYRVCVDVCNWAPWTCPGKLESSSEGRRSISRASGNARWGRNSRRRPFVWLRRAAAPSVKSPKQRFKRTTDSLHTFPVAPNLLDQDFATAGPNQKWGADISCVWTREGWLYLPSSSTSSPGVSSAGQPATGSPRNWHCRPCAGPLPCGVLPPG